MHKLEAVVNILFVRKTSLTLNFHTHILHFGCPLNVDFEVRGSEVWGFGGIIYMLHCRHI